MPDGKPLQLPVVISWLGRKSWLYPILYESVETDDVSQKLAKNREIAIVNKYCWHIVRVALYLSEVINDDDDRSRIPRNVGATFDYSSSSKADAKKVLFY